MLFLAKFSGDLLPVIVDETDIERAAARVLEETDERPAVLYEVPPGFLFAEVKFETAIDGDQNPANLSDMGVVLDPSEHFADWLESIDDEPLPELATAPTEPAPTEVVDGG